MSALLQTVVSMIAAIVVDDRAAILGESVAIRCGLHLEEGWAPAGETPRQNLTASAAHLEKLLPGESASLTGCVADRPASGDGERTLQRTLVQKAARLVRCDEVSPLVALLPDIF